MTKTIYLSKNLITMTPQEGADAILVSDGVIRLVGSRSQVLSYRDADTRIVDLQDKCLMPAFLDAHSHIGSYPAKLSVADVGCASNLHELVTIMKAFAQQNPVEKGEWICGFGYDHNFLSEQRHPDAQLLDKISVDNPVLVTHVSGHMGAVNTVGMHVLGISGNGYLEETDFMRASRMIQPPPAEKLSKLFDRAQHEYLRHGISTAQDGLTKTQEIQMLLRADKKLDVVCYVDMKDEKELIDEYAAYCGVYRDHLKIGGYKIFLDGSPQGKTAWVKEPYVGTKGECGYGIYDDDTVCRFFETAISQQRQILVHCNGDMAAEQFIRCLTRALNGRPNTAIRPVMIHAQLVTCQQLQQLKELGVIVSFFVDHTYYWGDIHLKNLGERAYRISPMQTANRLGITYTLHQDSPVIAPDMLHSVWSAVNRISKEGKVLGASERLNVYDALRAVTTHAAYQYFEEGEKGSIEAGKRADFVVLDRSPLRVDPMEIKDIQVMQTILADRSVFSQTDNFKL